MQKDYHGLQFHYPPEVEQQVEEDVEEDENENVSDQLKRLNNETNKLNHEEIEQTYDTSHFTEMKYIYDKPSSLFIDRPKSCQVC
jgi:hypothetical protein